MMSTRVHADDRLDNLYMKAMRCPYCHTKMEKGTTKCGTCGLTKEQIYYAELKQIRKGQRRQVLYSKVRPASIPYWKMAIGGAFGFLGIHCFVSRRYWRGIFILACVILFGISTVIWPENHWLRRAFEDKTFLFPADLLAIFGFVLWIWDWIAILFGKYKYPVVINEDTPAA